MEMKNMSVLDTLREHDRDFKISMINTHFENMSRRSLYHSLGADRNTSLSKGFGFKDQKSKQAFQQRILGNGSKVNFDVK